METGLYIVGTPIGNLQDITLRALDTLKAADVILAEDTRITRRLLDRHAIATPMLSYHKFNEASRVDEVVSRVRAGGKLALVTDAGMPGVSDPGARVVAACRAAGLPVFIIPGPSAVVSAVSLSGMAGDGFTFGGFLPHKSGQRRKRLAQLAQGDLPVVLYESPYRLLKLMTEIAEVLGPRRVFVARELTKHFEEGLVGTPAEITAHFAKRTVKGEIVVVIEASDEAPPAVPDATDADDEEADEPDSDQEAAAE